MKGWRLKTKEDATRFQHRVLEDKQDLTLLEGEIKAVAMPVEYNSSLTTEGQTEQNI